MECKRYLRQSSLRIDFFEVKPTHTHTPSNKGTYDHRLTPQPTSGNGCTEIPDSRSSGRKKPGQPPQYGSSKEQWEAAVRSSAPEVQDQILDWAEGVAETYAGKSYEKNLDDVMLSTRREHLLSTPPRYTTQCVLPLMPRYMMCPNQEHQSPQPTTYIIAVVSRMPPANHLQCCLRGTIMGTWRLVEGLATCVRPLCAITAVSVDMWLNSVVKGVAPSSAITRDHQLLLDKTAGAVAREPERAASRRCRSPRRGGRRGCIARPSSRGNVRHSVRAAAGHHGDEGAMVQALRGRRVRCPRLSGGVAILQERPRAPQRHRCRR
ncbi:hypothetical protein HPB51_022314 [Rhipicephalus microplus]|uniref:Uncharacterized protein n=1 Tax=Rhipicephalus microplus TaxID=6941 RepID=A0A9J6DQ47_RHIMP|nr:hypothetical protein HPB51_022314 [Rhipicephalus microplus]